MTVMPGVDGKPARAIKTAPGWAPAIPPFITYPVDNVAWGEMETPPFAPAKFYDKNEAPPTLPPPPPAPVPLRAAAPKPSGGALPVSDWFGLLRR
jgi:hypothetical protein